MGLLLALREADTKACKPVDTLDALLAGLTMPMDQPPVAIQPEPMALPTMAVAVPAVAVLASPAVVADQGMPSAMTIKQAAGAFLAANPMFDEEFASSRWTAKTRSQFDAAIFLADTFFGSSVDIASIDERQIADLFRTLRRLPATHHKAPAHGTMSLAEIIAANPGGGLSLVTTNRHMRFLRTVSHGLESGCRIRR